MTTDSDATIACSFCRKTRAEVEQLIAGPGVQICNECVVLCTEILAEARATDGPIEMPAARVVERQPPSWLRRMFTKVK